MARSEDSSVTYEDNINATQPVIYISDDSDLEDSGASRMRGDDEEVWYYMDPQGTVQGPFSMFLLHAWRQRGFFDHEFKVWRQGQPRQDAILLNELLVMLGHGAL